MDGVAEPFVDMPASFSVAGITDDIGLWIEAATTIFAAVMVGISILALFADNPCLAQSIPLSCLFY